MMLKAGFQLPITSSGRPGKREKILYHQGRKEQRRRKTGESGGVRNLWADGYVDPMSPSQPSPIAG